MINRERKCPLFDYCPLITATCAVRLPDEGCFWYRWFKKLIEEDEMGYNYTEYREGKRIKSSPQIDSNKYDEIFLLTKIAMDERLTEEEWNKILERFRKVEK